MVGECLGASTTPPWLACAIVWVVAVMMPMVPTRIVVMEVGIEPGVVPHMAIMISVVIVPIMSPVAAMVIGTAPRTPPEGIAHPIIPVVPVARRREHIGIHAIVVDVPIPAGP